MTSEQLPQGADVRLMLAAHDAGIEAENRKRIETTRLGYRFDGRNGFGLSIAGLVMLTAVLFLTFVLTGHQLDAAGASTNWLLFWGCFAPVALIPILPFVFFRPKTGGKALAWIAATVIVFALITAVLLWVLYAIVHAVA